MQAHLKQAINSLHQAAHQLISQQEQPALASESYPTTAERPARRHVKETLSSAILRIQASLSLTDPFYSILLTAY